MDEKFENFCPEYLGQNFSHFFVHILGNTTTSYFHSEISWSLGTNDISWTSRGPRIYVVYLCKCIVHVYLCECSWDRTMGSTNFEALQVILCQINIFCQQLTQKTDFVSFTQNFLKFKTCKTCVLNFRTICVNLSKSDKISPYILGLLVTKYVGLTKNSLYSSHISDMLRLSLGGGVFTNYLSS